ncbi:hypothetical protein HYV44_00450 [Candidatus Microgenomates bacterium]|nr:hypothetical protein [Candidatus Microgenomates bacterium]
MLEDQKEDYDKPDIVGEIDTVHEEIEYLEKKKKIPVWIWLGLIIVVSILTLMITANQSPTLIVQ